MYFYCEHAKINGLWWSSISRFYKIIHKIFHFIIYNLNKSIFFSLFESCYNLLKMFCLTVNVIFFCAVKHDVKIFKDELYH